jgi:hypothetical protein
VCQLEETYSGSVLLAAQQQRPLRSRPLGKGWAAKGRGTPRGQVGAGGGRHAAADGGCRNGDLTAVPWQSILQQAVACCTCSLHLRAPPSPSLPRARR